ncbi:hypothetical protein FHL04_07445 [Lactobacillus salsicarnum]|nr:hypothetical protein [Companilactobacillus mishanensis]
MVEKETNRHEGSLDRYFGIEQASFFVQIFIYKFCHISKKILLFIETKPTRFGWIISVSNSMTVLGGTPMKINKSLVGVFTFSAVILGALATTQTAKADTVTDTSQPAVTVTDTTQAPSATSASLAVPTSANVETNAQATSADDQMTATSATNTGNTYNGFQNSNSAATSTNTTEENTNGGDWNVDPVYSRPQDNFYMYENGSWVNDTYVNEAVPEQGTMNTMTGNINKQVEDDFINYSNSNDDSAGLAMNEATWFYQLTSNDDLSSIETTAPDLNNEIQSILDLKNVDQLAYQFTNMVAKDQPTPFTILINRDQNDPTKKAMYLMGAQPLMLTSQGIGSDQENDVVAFLQTAGYSDDAIQDIITATVNYDQLLMNVETATDLAASTDDNRDYPSVNFQDLCDMMQYVNLHGISKTLTNSVPDSVYEMTPSYFNHINELINTGTFKDLQGWLVSDLILYRSGEISNITDGFQSFLQSTDPQQAEEYMNNPDNLSPELQKTFAYYLTSSAFTDAFSQYYGPKIVTQSTKNAATILAKKVIYAYSTQIINSNWLDTATKRNALGKLSRIQMNIGYPSKSDFDYFNRVDIEGFNSPYMNYRNVVGSQALQNFADFTQPVDRGAWQEGNSALDPDASYDRMTNSITINAGIMSAPFFSTSQDDSKNFGGLGMVIGHELTHGFDATGSLYDGNGELNDWWSKDDRARFNQKVDNMAAEFNGIPYGGGYVDGVQTEDENIADNGGLNVSLAALQMENNYNLDEYFQNYALGWRSKYDPSAYESQLEDVHTPDSIRVNTSLQNISQFYDTYDVQPGDGMYLAEDKRVNIW